ncbi:hypothetical protein [Agromyces sp. NPDC058064]
MDRVIVAIVIVAGYAALAFAGPDEPVEPTSTRAAVTVGIVE